MAVKRTQRTRRVPQRTCIACRTVLAKRELIRVVRTPDAGVQIDPSGKRPGRGTYLHNDVACWTKARQSNWAIISKALKITLTVDDCQQLATFAESLTETGT